MLNQHKCIDNGIHYALAKRKGQGGVMSRFFDARNNVVCANLRNIFLNLQKEFHATFKLIIVPIMHQRSLLSDIVAFISKPYNNTWNFQRYIF